MCLRVGRRWVLFFLLRLCVPIFFVRGPPRIFMDYSPTKKYDSHFTVVSTSPTTSGFELTHCLYDSYKSGKRTTAGHIFWRLSVLFIGCVLFSNFVLFCFISGDLFECENSIVTTPLQVQLKSILTYLLIINVFRRYEVFD